MSNINEPLLLVFSLAKAQSLILKKFDRLSIHGLGFSDFLILYLLNADSEGKMRRIDLADKMGLTASGVTRLLAPMEKIKLVGRQSNERDARVSYVLITSVGREVYEEASITAQQIAKEIFPSLKSRNFKAITEMLLGLGANFK